MIKTPIVNHHPNPKIDKLINPKIPFSSKNITLIQLQRVQELSTDYLNYKLIAPRTQLVYSRYHNLMRLGMSQWT